MTHILHTSTVHKIASLAYDGNSAYCQSSGARNIKYNPWILALRGHLNTDVKAKEWNSERFALENDALTSWPQLNNYNLTGLVRNMF